LEVLIVLFNVMNISQVKKSIRNTVRRQIRETSRKASGIPKDFDSFQIVFANSLIEAGAPTTLVDEALTEFSDDSNEIYNVMWESWENIRSEMSNVTDPSEKTDLWCELKEYYVKDVVSSLLDSR